MEDSQMKRVTNVLAGLGGGAAAGFTDAKFADKKPLGLSVGTLGGLAAAALGMSKFGGKYRGALLEAGVGALSYELGKKVYARTAKPAGTQGVAGLPNMWSYPSNIPGLDYSSRQAVGALPQGRIVTNAELQHSLSMLRRFG